MPGSPEADDRATELPARALRLLVVTSAPPLKRVPEPFLLLLDSGVELVFALPGGTLPGDFRTHPLASSVELPVERRGPEARAVALFRAAADLSRFLDPTLAHAHWPRRRALRRVLMLGGLAKSRALTREVAPGLQLPPTVSSRVRVTFRELERLLPAPPELEQAVAELGVSAVLLVSRCVLGGFDPDVLKVARVLGLPSIMLVFSWDNLSSKAVLNEHPDHLLVWNEIQAREAVEQHGLDPERVVVTGAANFDRFFDELPSNGRSPATGEGPATILYLGSSPKVAVYEQPIFEEWLTAVRSSPDAALRQAKVILRPHPAAGRRWKGWSTRDSGVAVLSPESKTEQAKLAGLLAVASAVVALNTSAELEAAIAGKPVLTFRAGSKARGQEGSAHFRYLLSADGGFVTDARTLDEHVAKLAAAIRGDHDPAPARRFVERFLRPAGISEPVAPRLAATILDLAQSPSSRRTLDRSILAEAR
jgi:hypothetical protein